jgi:TPR repeat protein
LRSATSRPRASCSNAPRTRRKPEAALMLGTTYDPLVIGNQDMRSIAPDPAMARQWYQKAAALGSADARRRLSQIQN